MKNKEEKSSILDLLANQKHFPAIICFILIPLGLVAIFSFLTIFCDNDQGLAIPAQSQVPAYLQGKNGPSLPHPPFINCDYLLINGLIVDGSGKKPYYANIAIQNDSILAIGDFYALPPTKIINAQGQIICPGFIDIHTHTDDYWLAHGDGKIMISQGITSHIVGNCGTSTSNISAYLQKINPPAINVGTLIGYKALRRGVVEDNAQAKPQQIEKMQQKLAQALQEGAFGLSLGLSYYPQDKASYQELLALSKTTKKFDGLLAVHIRNEDDQVIPSLKEAISLAKASGVRFQYSHIKSMGQENWPKHDILLKMIDQAQADGVDIQSDVYVYPFSSWDFQSKKDTVCEDNIRKSILHPAIMIASDSGLSASGKAIHPRAYANSIVFLQKFIFTEHLLPIETAIQKMTSMPAQRMQIPDRGLIYPGYKADIVIFHPLELQALANRENPNQLSQGMSYVFINGQPALANNVFTNIKNGQVLRKTK